MGILNSNSAEKWNKEKGFPIGEIGIVPEHFLPKPVFYGRTDSRTDQLLSHP